MNDLVSAIGVIGEDVPIVHSLFIMVRGDVHVLKRIEKSDRRAERVSRILIRKLSRKKKNQRSHIVTKSPILHPLSFASETNFLRHDKMVVAQRRLVKARDHNGRRAFYVEEIGVDDEEPLTLLVAPKSEGSCEDLVAKMATKDDSSQARSSESFVCLLESDGAISLGKKQSTSVHLKKLHIDNGITLFYAYTKPHNETKPSPPWTLGLDKQTFLELQLKLTRILGSRMATD